MATKYLLVEDVEGLGRKGEIVSAKPGHARNYLIPQGFALMANPNTLRLQARLQAEREAKAAEDRREAEAQAAQIGELQLEVVVKVDPEGHMYGSVSAHDISHLLGKKGILLDKRDVQLKHALKTLGSHKVSLKLKESVAATVVVNISAEGQPLVTEAKTKEETHKEE